MLDLAYAASPATTAIPAKVTSPDPKRLLLKSYGFGPQGSEKRLELMISKAYFEFESPAGVTLRGADDCSPLSLDTGSSGTKIYSGVDAAGDEPQRPAFAVTPCDEAEAKAGIIKPDTVDRSGSWSAWRRRHDSGHCRNTIVSRHGRTKRALISTDCRPRHRHSAATSNPQRVRRSRLTIHSTAACSLLSTAIARC